MSKRLASLDALRGCTVAAMLLVNDPGDWGHVYAPLEHSAWHGCTPTDLVFPFFLFVVGVSVALAILPRLEQGGVGRVDARGAVACAAHRRVGRGDQCAGGVAAAASAPALSRRAATDRRVLCRGGTVRDLHETARAMGGDRGLTARLRAAAALGGSLEPWSNIVSRTDSAVFGRFVYLIDPATGRGHDPEGLLATLPALAGTLLGLRAGDWLRRGQFRPLLLAGIVCLLLGALWSLWLPLNKNLWTPSFVLWCTGWAIWLCWCSTG